MPIMKEVFYLSVCYVISDGIIKTSYGIYIMRLKLKNIGKLKSADIELSGITVIGGENNTGKSTVGKALFSIFNAFYNKEQKIHDEYVYALKKTISGSVSGIRLLLDSSYTQAIKEILTNREEYIKNPESIVDYWRTHVDFNDEIPIKTILEILQLSEEIIFNTLLTNQLERDFNGQIRTIYAEPNNIGSIELTLKQKSLSITVTEEKKITYSEECTIITEAIYIDHPYLLDSLDNKSFFRERSRNHLYNLKKILLKKKNTRAIEDILINKKLEKVFNTINSACSGTMVYNNARFEYQEKGKTKGLDVKNLSSGLKTFIIIKTLLETGALRENGVFILDEPEIHLHPKWQLLFAEIIVLLHKEFGMHVLINTHSPYFIEAIEVYSKKYGISNCKYYLAENISEYVSEIRDVSNETELIYKKLAEPFKVLESIESEDSENDE